MTSKVLAMAGLLAAMAASHASAQLVTVYSPVIGSPVVVQPAPVVAYRPILPAPYLVASPVVSAPVVAAPPAVVSPAPAVVTTGLAPTPIVTRRFRPILGGTVTRVRYGYTPVSVVTPLY